MHYIYLIISNINKISPPCYLIKVLSGYSSADIHLPIHEYGERLSHHRSYNLGGDTKKEECLLYLFDEFL